MGAITNKIFELLESGNNIETSRATGIIINCPKLSNGWFDAIDDDGRGIKNSDGKESAGVEFDKKRTIETKPDISDIP